MPAPCAHYPSELAGRRALLLFLFNQFCSSPQSVTRHAITLPNSTVRGAPKTAASHPAAAVSSRESHRETDSRSTAHRYLQTRSAISKPPPFAATSPVIQNQIPPVWNAGGQLFADSHKGHLHPRC